MSWQPFLDPESYDFLMEDFPDLKRRNCIKKYIDNKLVGLIVGAAKGNELFIEYVRVLPEYRKQGIFKQLISELESWSKIHCCIRETNLASRKAFESVGFKFIQFKTPYSNGDKKMEYGKLTTS